MKHPEFCLLLILTIFIALNFALLIAIVIKLKLPKKCITTPDNKDYIETRGFSSFDAKRILRGSYVDINKYTFIVGLVKYLNNIAILECGGVIISRLWFLTAGHCEVIVAQWGTLVPFYAVGGNSKWKQGHYHTVIYHVKHEDYSYGVELSNDIALIKVREPFARRHEILIALASDQYIYQVNKSVQVIGWGKEGNDEYKPSDVLKAATVLFLDFKYCRHLYKEAEIAEREEFELDHTMFCAGNYKNGSDACQADSGGPLVDGRLLIGLVSWGNKCGFARFPSVYTRVTLYKDWIMSVGQKLDENIGVTFSDSPPIVE